MHCENRTLTAKRLRSALFTHASGKFLLGSLWFFYAAIFLTFSFKFADTDLYWIIPTGRNILQNHIVPHINPFISIPDTGIVIQNWLYCVLTAWFYEILGSIGLYLFQLLQLAAMVLCIFRFFDFRRSNNKAMIGLFTIFLLGIFGYTNLRPQMLTFILIMIELFAVKGFLRTGKKWLLFVLPLSVLLEINIHASYWIMHFVVLLPYLVPGVDKLRIPDAGVKKQQRIYLLTAAICMLPFLFLNPYGLKGITYVLNALSSGVIKPWQIGEQQSFVLRSVWAWVYIGLLFVALWLWSKRKLLSTELYMFLGFSVLFATAVKWLPYFALGSMYLMRALYRLSEGQEKFRFVNLKISRMVTVCIPLAAIFVLLVRAEACDIDKLNTGSSYLDSCSVKSCDYSDLKVLADHLDVNDPEGSVFAVFSDSNYWEFRGYTIYSDARPEIYTEAIAGNNDIAIKSVAAAFGIDYYGYVLDLDKDKTVSAADYVLTAEEYEALLISIEADWFVVDLISRPNLYAALSGSGSFNEVLRSVSYVLYCKEAR